MRGSVWVLLACYLTNRKGIVFAKTKVYGYSEVRQINTLQQQKVQYYKAINKALATYRSNNNLDSDTEVGYTHLNDGITYEGSIKGVKIIKRKKTKLTGVNKREVRKDVLRTQELKSEKGRYTTKKEMRKMYDKKVTQKEYKKRTKIKSKQVKNYYEK